MDQDNRNDVVAKFQLIIGSYSKQAYIIHNGFNDYRCSNSYTDTKCQCGRIFPKHLVIQRNLLNGN